MKTRIGSSPRSLRRTLLSDNARLVKPAQERIDNILARANNRHDNALRVDGVELTLWRMQNAGLLCTCYSTTSDANSISTNNSSDDVTIPTSGGSGSSVQVEVDEEGEVEVTSRIDYTHDGTNFSVVSLRDDRQARTKGAQRDILEDEDFAASPTQKYFPQTGTSDIHFDDEDAEHNAPHQSDMNALDIDAEFEEFDFGGESDDDKARLVRSVEALLSGGESNPCGICFSSGWTEGYQLFNGRRVVLTTLDFDSTGGFIVDHNVRPSLFKGASSATPVQWTVDFPGYFYSVLRVEAWNNLSQISNIKVMAKFKGTDEFVLLTPSVLFARSGMDNTDTIIQAAPVDNDVSSVAQVLFSHVEIIFELAPKIIGQIPQVEIAETFEYYEALIQTNVEWPSRVSSISTGSVVIDSKHKRAWRIVSVNQNKTADSKSFGLETQAMMLQQKEPLERLNIYRKRYITNKNYKGLEPVQGARQTGQ